MTFLEFPDYNLKSLVDPDVIAVTDPGLDVGSFLSLLRGLL
jgi:hypothetical protein